MVKEWPKKVDKPIGNKKLFYAKGELIEYNWTWI